MHLIRRTWEYFIQVCVCVCVNCKMIMLNKVKMIIFVEKTMIQIPDS